MTRPSWISPGHIDDELSMFGHAGDGINLAHGGNPTFVGETMLNVRDPDGKLASAEIIKTGLAQDDGWVDFRWPDPVSKKIEAKSGAASRWSPPR